MYNYSILYFTKYYKCLIIKLSHFKNGDWILSNVAVMPLTCMAVTQRSIKEN